MELDENVDADMMDEDTTEDTMMKLHYDSTESDNERAESDNEDLESDDGSCESDSDGPSTFLKPCMSIWFDVHIVLANASSKNS